MQIFDYLVKTLHQNYIFNFFKRISTLTNTAYNCHLIHNVNSLLLYFLQKVSLILWKSGLTMKPMEGLFRYLYEPRWPSWMFAYTGIYHLVMLGLRNLFSGKWIPKKWLFIFFNDCILYSVTNKFYYRPRRGIILQCDPDWQWNGHFSMIYMPSAVSHKISSKRCKLR